MTTRINTKLAIILSVVAVVVLAGGYWAVTTFIVKNAKQHAEIADRALVEAAAAHKAGDYEGANLFVDRAAMHYHAAHRKDIGNTEYLYNSILANELYTCGSETEAGNQLSMILSASQLAHDSTRASEADKAQVYTRLMNRHRMTLIVDESRPWIPQIYAISDAQYLADPESEMARRWRGIAGVYLLRNDMPAEERAVSLDDLNDALSRADNDPVLLHHIAMWHFNEAQRLRDAGGEDNAALALEHVTEGLSFSTRSYQAAPQDPFNVTQHISILMQAPLNIEGVREDIGETLLSLARRLAAEPEARAALFNSEIVTVINWLAIYPQVVAAQEAAAAAEIAAAAEPGSEGAEPVEIVDTQVAEEDAQPEAPQTPEAITLGVQIGEALVADDAGRADHHFVLAQARLAEKDYAAAIAALEAGLKTSRPLSPQNYMLERQTRISMLATLASTYTTMSADTANDPQARVALLDQADQALARYRVADGANTSQHEAHADYLAGRAAFVRQVPHIAIGHLEKANLYYKDTNLQVLLLLAKAYDARGFSGEAAKNYELVLLLQPRARNERLRLVQLYINLGGDKLNDADDHINRYLQFNNKDVQAWLLKAQVLGANRQYTQAAEIIDELGLDDYPALAGVKARYLSQAGEDEAALQLIHDRLAVEPNDRIALGVLFSIITDQTERLAALDGLVANGMTPENDRQFRRLIESGGTLSPEEWEAFATGEGNISDVDMKKQMFTRYAGVNDREMMRETLAVLVTLAPNDPDVLTWRYALAAEDKDWRLANNLIDQMLELGPVERPQIAVSDGVFLRAQVLAGEISADTPEGTTPDQREAVRAYRRALEDNPTHAPGWIDLGRLYMVQQDWQRARDALNRAHQIQPTNPQVSVLLPRVLRFTGEIDLALDLYRDATRRFPNNTALRNEYYELEATAGIPRLVVAGREAIRETQPNDVENRQGLATLYAQAERYEEALAEVDAIIQIEGPSLETTAVRAGIHAVSGAVQLGVDVFDAYLAQRGAEAESRDYLAYGMFLGRYERKDESEAAIQQAISMEDPQSRLASRRWAAVLGATGRFADSARLFQELIQQFPADDSLKTDLATVLMSMGSFDRAQTALAGVSASARREHMRAQVELRRGDAEAALAIAREGRRTYSDSSELEIMEARVLSQLADEDMRAGETDRGRSRFAEAMVIYDRIVQRNASLYEVRVLMARIELRLGQVDQAVTRLVRILDDQPNSMQARATLFEVYLSQALNYPTGDTRRQELAQSALSIVTPLLAVQPENVVALRGAGQAAAETGAFQRSAGYYQAAFDLSDEAGDLVGVVSAYLASGQASQVDELLRNPDVAGQLRESLILRAMQARARASISRNDEARNLFISLIRQANNSDEVAAITGQIYQSALRNEIVQIVETATGETRPAVIDVQLALYERGAQDWDAVIARLGGFEASPIDNENIQMQAMSLLAMAYQSNGEEDNLLRAKAIYERLLADPVNTNNIELLNNLAYLLTDQLTGRDYARQAVGYAQRAVDQMTTNAAPQQRALVLDTLGWAQFHAGDSEAAIATLKQSIGLDSLSVNNKHLGMVYMAQGTNSGDNFAIRYLADAKDKETNTAERDAIQQLMDGI